MQYPYVIWTGTVDYYGRTPARVVRTTATRTVAEIARLKDALGQPQWKYCDSETEALVLNAALLMYDDSDRGDTHGN